MTTLKRALGVVLMLPSLVAGQYGTYVNPEVLDACPGYNAFNISSSASMLQADLMLAGSPCNVFGHDINHLNLQVVYETGAFSLFEHQGLDILNRCDQILEFTLE